MPTDVSQQLAWPSGAEPHADWQSLLTEHCPLQVAVVPVPLPVVEPPPPKPLNVESPLVLVPLPLVEAPLPLPLVEAPLPPVDPPPADPLPLAPLLWAPLLDETPELVDEPPLASEFAASSMAYKFPPSPPQ